MAVDRRSVEVSRGSREVDGASRRVHINGRRRVRDGPRTPLSLHPRFQSHGYADPSEVGRGPNAPCAQRSARRERVAREGRRGFVRPPPVGRLGRRSLGATTADQLTDCGRRRRSHARDVRVCVCSGTVAEAPCSARVFFFSLNVRFASVCCRDVERRRRRVDPE